MLGLALLGGALASLVSGLPKLSELTDPDLPLELARQLKRKHSEPPRRFTTRSRSRSPGRPQASGSK